MTRMMKIAKYKFNTTTSLVLMNTHVYTLMY